MARVPSHLITRSGVYNYRRRVPEELRGRPEFKGRGVFQVSLGVRTLDQAHKQVVALKLDDLFQVHHAAHQEQASGMVLTQPLLRQLASEAYHQAVEALQSERSQYGHDDRRAEMDEMAAQTIWALNDPKIGANARALFKRDMDSALEAQARGTASRLGITPSPENIESMKAAFLDAEIASEAARVDIASGRVFPTPPPQFASSGAAKSDVPTAREAHWTFKKLSQAAQSQNPNGDSWEHKVTTVTDLFDEYLGPVPIYKIDRSKVRQFMNDIQSMPQRMTMRFPGMTLQEAIKANKAREKPYPTVSPNTARDGYFSVLRWAFGYAVDLEVLPVNPCTGIKIRGATKATGKRTRNPFTVDELNAFFRLPIFTGCLSEKRPNTPGNFTFDDHRKWAPLILLFSGARPSEIAQLAVTDIKTGGPHPYISILTEYDPDDPDEERDFVVSHKTENARRDIPIHPKLIELGLLSYVQRRKEAGDVRLFPEWKQSSDGRKLYSSASWIRNLNDKQIPKITTRRPKPTLYSFRHTWKTQMAISEVPAQYQNQILGHAQKGMDEHYLGRMDIEHTYNAVSRVSFDKLDIDHLKSY